jgi:hypothetical protein
LLKGRYVRKFVDVPGEDPGANDERPAGSFLNLAKIFHPHLNLGDAAAGPLRGDLSLAQMNDLGSGARSERRIQ